MTAMSIVAHAHPFVVSVDTHARNPVYAILDATNGAGVYARSARDGLWGYIAL